jgi:hypothetical protein
VALAEKIRMRTSAVALLLTLFVFTLCLSAKSKAEIPEQLLHAQYVALGYETANGFVSETDLASTRILPEDRQALENVRQALKAWKRYIITIDPHQAELLIAVRSGRVASAKTGVAVIGSNGPRGGIGVGPVIGAEAGPANDYLAVYDADNGEEGIRLWRGDEKDGLDSPPSLLRSFRDDVEAAAKRRAKKP